MHVRTKEELLNLMIENFDYDIDVYEGTLTYAIFSTVASAIEREYTIKDEEEKDIFIRDGHNKFLDERITEFGYERKDGEYAVGQVTFEGCQPNAWIPTDLELFCNGMKFIVIQEDARANEEGIGKAMIRSEEVGLNKNIDSGQIFTTDKFSCNRIYNENAITGGVDNESDDDLRTRFFYTQRHKGTSGNVYHYEEWSKEVTGVDKAKVNPLKYGEGTVEVVVSGKSDKVTEDVLKNVKTHVEEVQPIGAKLTVKTMDYKELNISAKVKSYMDRDYIKGAFEDEVEEYLKSVHSEIVYTKLLSILAKMMEIEDVTEFKINEGRSNIQLKSEELPKLKNITIEVVE